MQLTTSRAVAALTLVGLLASPASFAFKASGSRYKTQQGGEIEFYENGQPKKISGNAKCTGVKVVVQPAPMPAPQEHAPESRTGERSGRDPRPTSEARVRAVQIGGAAYGHIALQIPVDAMIASLESFSDATLSTPLLINGELVVWGANNNVAAEAEAFAGPAQPGFVWVGFRTNPLLENVGGSFEQDFTWVVSFDEGGYPEPGSIGTHSVGVYISDNAESPDPLLEWHTIY